MQVRCQWSTNCKIKQDGCACEHSNFHERALACSIQKRCNPNGHERKSEACACMEEAFFTSQAEALTITGAGTSEDPVRYEHIKSDDPDRKAKRAAQRDQFTADAKAGRVLCLSDLMISHGM